MIHVAVGNKEQGKNVLYFETRTETNKHIGKYSLVRLNNVFIPFYPCQLLIYREDP